MSIQFSCPFCFRRYKVKDELAGASRKCKQCGRRLEIPGGPSPRHPRELQLLDPIRERLVLLRKLHGETCDPVLSADQVADIEEELHCVLPDAILALLAAGVNALHEEDIAHICDYQELAAGWRCPADLFVIGEEDGHVIYLIPRYSNRSATVGVTCYCDEDGSTAYLSLTQWLEAQIRNQFGLNLEEVPPPTPEELAAFCPRLV